MRMLAREDVGLGFRLGRDWLGLAEISLAGNVLAHQEMFQPGNNVNRPELRYAGPRCC
jgi:hypothetical protein